METYQNIESPELNKMIKDKEKFILLDVRTKEEFDIVHIPNSINIPVENLNLEIDKLLPYKDDKIVIYCRSGRRSIHAANILNEFGFYDLYNLKYGIIGHLDYL